MASISSEVKSRLRESDSLLSALDALTNMRAFMVLFSTVLAFVLAAGVLFGMSAWVASKSPALGGVLALFAGLFCAAVGLIGTNAAGILLMDEASGRAQRSAMDALLASLFTSHRLVLVFLLEIILFFVFVMVISILLFVCKLPGVGPVLFTVVFPLGSLLMGVIFFALMYVVIPLAAPAIWGGSTVSQVIAMLGLVWHQRLAYVIILELLLALVVGVVASLISVILVSGVTTVLSLSGLIVGMEVGDDFAGALRGIVGMVMAGSGNSASGYVLALGFGAGFLLLCAAIFPMLVSMKGGAIIYINAIGGLHIADAAAQMMGAVDGMKARAQEARERAIAAGAASAASLAPPLAPAAAPAAAGCPACHVAITPADVFCGNCGHKLT